MQFTVTFPDTSFNTVEYSATTNTVVGDLILTVAEEWGVDPDIIDIAHGLDRLSKNTLLCKGLSNGDELTAHKKQKNIFTKEDLQSESVSITKYYTANPDKTCFLDAASMTANRVLNCRGDIIPSAVKHIAFVTCCTVTEIGVDFLKDSNIKTVDLSPFCSVRIIQKGFLAGCQHLESLNLTPLSNVRTIQKSFLEDCHSLSELCLLPLKNVSKIEAYFMAGCKNIRSLDLSSLTHVRTFGDGFLSQCCELQMVEMSNLKLTSVGKSFMYGCSSIETVDLVGLQNVTRIGDCFLSDCTSLTSIDLSMLSNVTAIDDFFLAYCESLTQINFSGLTSLCTIGNSFLEGCVSITSPIEITSLVNVTLVGDSFLYDCPAIDSPLKIEFCEDAWKRRLEVENIILACE
eukprot:TRINITY_DN1446_c1_g1_i2.p1 TRINITY_DN1446_c1_g1~~TRINITY_DN1446_c1_g1_i2.p1  ORF type:complete len:431 (+),score=75.11 TRINITY_DN1446_c1_g1_i2:86-1294(+)